MHMTQAPKLALLGAGKIGSILLQAFIAHAVVSRDRVVATVHRADKAASIASALGIPVSTDNRQAAEKADVIFLCVKPQTIGEVLKEIGPVLDSSKLLISVAASVPTAYIEQKLAGKVPVVRAMPNTPSQVGCGMTALCGGAFATTPDIKTAERMFNTVGRTVVLDEKHMNAVTGLSASGPAFIYVVIESLAEAGVKVGLPRDVATLLATQTVLGSAKMVLDTGHHPALLKDGVTTPAGCTVDGLLELEEGGLRVTLITAVVKAAERAGQLLFS
jgi:pyrroline-5-carboxylate reductase